MKRKTLLQSFIVHNNRIKDFFRIMRISLFLLFVCVCQLMAVEAGAQSAEIKISQNSMTIRQLNIWSYFEIRMSMPNGLFLLKPNRQA